MRPTPRSQLLGQVWTAKDWEDHISKTGVQGVLYKGINPPSSRRSIWHKLKSKVIGRLYGE